MLIINNNDNNKINKKEKVFQFFYYSILWKNDSIIYIYTSTHKTLVVFENNVARCGIVRINYSWKSLKDCGITESDGAIRIKKEIKRVFYKEAIFMTIYQKPHGMQI